MKCPQCEAECICDEVDIGVGTLCGPAHCPDCGWSEQLPEYDVDDDELPF